LPHRFGDVSGSFGATRNYSPQFSCQRAGGISVTGPDAAWIASSAEFTPTPIQTRDERADLVYAVKIRVPNDKGLLKIGMPVDVDLDNRK